MNRRWIVAAALGFVLGAEANAQSVTGTVTRGGAPVEGAIVVLVAGGDEAARAVTREGGRYSLQAPAGTYAVRVLQIGYRPLSLPAVLLRAGATTTRDVSLGTARVDLTAVSVSDRAQCRVRPDSSVAAFVVWDAARASLLATLLTRGEPVTATVAINDRTFDKNGARILSDSSRMTSTRSLAPVRSLGARSLADSGYVRTSGNERAFWAPDAEVLLAEEFVATHCMRAVTSSHPDSAGLIGVQFEPARTRRDIVDIAGVVWLDGASAELRKLEYRYVNVPDIARSTRAGGSVEFLRIPRGRWIAHRWSLRYPIVAVRQLGGGAVLVPGMRTESNSREELLGIRESSGTIMDIRRGATGADTLWQRGRVSVLAQVVDSATGAPVRGVELGFAGSPDATGTDTTGSLRIERVVPGSQTLRIRSAELVALGVPQILRDVVIPARDDERIVIVVPSALSMLVARCGAASAQWGEGMLVGRAQPDSGGRMPASVVAVTRTPYVKLGTSELLFVDRVLEAPTAVDGSFHVCGVPRDARIRLRRSIDPPGSGVAVTFPERAFTASVVLPAASR